MSKTPSIHDWVGGTEAIGRWLDDGGSRLAVENSALDADPPPHAPVPRWGWGVAPPYQP